MQILAPEVGAHEAIEDDVTIYLSLELFPCNWTVFIPIIV
jgi:hypothetical protein